MRPELPMILCALSISLAAPPANAGRALLSGVIDGEYRRGFGDDAPVRNAFVLSASARLLAGATWSYCGGFDAEVGGGNPGALYRADGYVAGLGYRLESGGFVAVCAGAGIEGLPDEADRVRWLLPAELRLESVHTFGVVRPILRLRVAVTESVAGDSGSPTVPGLDQWLAVAGVRFALPARPAPGLETASGLWLAVAWQEAWGARFFGVRLGYGFYAAH